jgi:predicted N-formylglutamate amidohydrolase
MKLVNIAKKPQLVPVVLDDEDTIKEYGEPLEFWCYDRQPLDTFMRFAAKANDPSVMVEIVQDLILDEDGQPVMRDGNILPSKMMIRCVNKLMDTLGN